MGWNLLMIAILQLTDHRIWSVARVGLLRIGRHYEVLS